MRSEPSGEWLSVDLVMFRRKYVLKFGLFIIKVSNFEGRLKRLEVNM